jgi:hypothetical protein
MKSILIGILVLVAIVEARIMVADTSELLDSIDCFTNNGYGELLFRGLMKNGVPDPNAKQNLIVATDIDCTVYLQPCFKCGNPRKQIQDTCEAIDGTGFVYRPYIVVEDPQDWSSDTAANRAFLEEIADEVVKQRNCFDNQRFRSTKFDWEKILGQDYIKWASKYLWYVSTDKKPDFNDFKPFGGWRSPLIKQYDQTEHVCEHTVNLDVQNARLTEAPSKVKLSQAQ